MLPRNLNKKAFMSYECKAEYILEKINPETDFKEIFYIIENIATCNAKSYTLEDYISRLFYIEFIFKKNNVKSKENIKSMDILKKMLLEYIVFKKRKSFEQSILDKYGVYFNDIKFLDDKENIHGYIDDVNYIKLNISLGYILVTYYKNLIYKDNVINSIIDKLGDIIERRECIGIVN